MHAPPHPLQLVAEEEDDCHAVIHLMKHHVAWPQERRCRPVDIRVGRSYHEIANRDYLHFLIQQSGLRALGLIVDADLNMQGRWTSLRSLLRDLSFQETPDDLPEQGLITVNRSGVRAGVWVMPNNKSEGMLEPIREEVEGSELGMVPCGS